MIQPVSHKPAKTTFASAKFHGTYSATELKNVSAPITDLAQLWVGNEKLHVEIRKAKFNDKSFYGEKNYYLDIHLLGKSNIFNKKPVWKVRIPENDLSEYSPEKGETIFNKIKERLKQWDELIKNKDKMTEKPSDKDFFKGFIPKKREKITAKIEEK